MGLDMYLSARVTLASWRSAEAEETTKKIKLILDTAEIPEKVSENTDSVGLVIPVAYWRKANAIHDWFVRNVQNNVDDCGTYPVSREQLQELHGLCKIVIDAKRDEEIAEATASSYLPPASGFFFGSQDVDEWYYRCLEYTKERIETLLSMKDMDYFEYSSSW